MDFANAKPFESLPGPSPLTMLIRFLPGGKTKQAISMKITLNVQLKSNKNVQLDFFFNFSFKYFKTTILLLLFINLFII